ncbi:PDDEXK nuclease domain-containing protein [Mycolicibacterium lutetiense]|uniref:Nuclease of restriction endonuclease-like (RecB) superfamily n=1 Tax=Mycolicibacterium lutetiense TaxID=1641992 RepID=A0ABS4ZU16_9MYCO|nr:PDDEXK nuclease domain-containing protein [Mycolicibacterium lutetiense]MBP2453007.1 putative nuclease of restriction endonuclease-like (RecB) superfamily [Mycolicibacterium lutetiense]
MTNQQKSSSPSTGSRLATTAAAVPAWYPELLDAVAGHVQIGRQRAVAAANKELLTTYWAVGSEILARQEAQGWGARVIDRLSADLRERFPDAKGFSARNLKYMRAFAAAWPDAAIVQARLAQLPWYHHIALLEKLNTSDLRLWYAQAAVDDGWSRSILVHHIETGFHRRAGRAITNFARTLPPADSDLAQQATRDPYLFDFVGIADIRREYDLERVLTDHVEKFLLELGQGFAFVGRQVHLEIGDADFYADLLFYHLRLRCFVVIELKAGDFDPSYLGQLGMYMAAVDDLLRHAEDKPTIGLMLCKSKNNVVAEYALRGYAAPIGVAEWKTAITANLPEELQAGLPTVEELEAELEGDMTKGDSP